MDMSKLAPRCKDKNKRVFIAHQINDAVYLILYKCGVCMKASIIVDAQNKKILKPYDGKCSMCNSIIELADDK